MRLFAARFRGMSVDALRAEVIALERKINEGDLDEGDLEAAEIDLEDACSELARVEQELAMRIS